MILEEWRLFKKLPKRSLKKNSDFDKIWTRAHQILAGLVSGGARHILESSKFFFPVKESDNDFWSNKFH